MNTSNINHIRLTRVIANVLNSRDVVRQLRNVITSGSSKDVILDFWDVEFISRSAAHELLRLKKDLVGYNITFKNFNKDVEQMIVTVQTSTDRPLAFKGRFKAKQINFDNLRKELTNSS